MEALTEYYKKLKTVFPDLPVLSKKKKNKPTNQTKQTNKKHKKANKKPPTNQKTLAVSSNATSNLYHETEWAALHNTLAYF